MEKPRFQFSVRRLLLATFWAGISCVGGTLLYNVQHQFGELLEEPLVFYLLGLLGLTLATLGFFTAVGSLIGEAHRFAAYGMTFVVLAVAGVIVLRWIFH